MQIIQISKEGEENLRLKTPLADKDLLYEPVGEYQFYCAEAIPEERSLAFSVSDGRVTSMTFRLAHDYVPAGPQNGFAGSFLSLGSYILLTVLWLSILIVLGSKDRLQTQLFSMAKDHTSHMWAHSWCGGDCRNASLVFSLHNYFDGVEHSSRCRNCSGHLRVFHGN